MKYLLLIVHADPRGQSTSHQLAARTKAVLEQNHHEVKIVDLIKAGFKENASEDDFIDKKPDQKFSYLDLQKPSNLSPVIVEQQNNLKWSNLVLHVTITFPRIHPTCFHNGFWLV